MTTHTTHAPAVPAVVDPAALFRYSGMLDGLRDALAQLLGVDNDPEALRDAVARYNLLRDRLIATVDDAAVVEICTLTDPLDHDATMQRLYLACVSLARLVDLIVQTPDFLLSQEVRSMNAGEIRTQMDNARPRAVNSPSVLHFGIGG